MAELLVYAQPHWFDTATDERRAELVAMYGDRFGKRLLVGDIVNIYPDGTFGNDYANEKIKLVRVTPANHNAYKHLRKKHTRPKNDSERAEILSQVQGRLNAERQRRVANNIPPFSPSEEVVWTSNKARSLGIDEEIVVHRKQYRIDISKLTAKQQKDFAEKTIISITIARLQIALVDKDG